MAGGGQEIDAIGLDVDGEMAGGLGGIDDEGDVVVAGDAADLRDGLDGSRHITDVGDGDQARVGADSSGDFLGIDQASGGIDGDASLLDPAAVGHGIQWAKDGIVIDVGADGVATLLRIDQALDGDVEGVGTIEGEDEMLGLFAVEEFV